MNTQSQKAQILARNHRVGLSRVVPLRNRVLQRAIAGLLLAALMPLVAASAPAQAQNPSVVFDASRIIKSFDSEGVSVNLNFFLDDQALLNPATPLAGSLTTMGANILRFPGGEKSDNYLWSVPPFSQADPHFAVTGAKNCAHTYNQSAASGPYTTDYLTPIDATLDFDEFMQVVDATGSEAFITVNGDAHRYNGPCAKVDLDTLVTTAAEWVRYANVTHNMGIEYWMVGNETWNASAHDTGSVPTPAEAAADFVAIASAMRAVDPSITIIANTRHGAWIDTLVTHPGALELIDAVGVSNYPINGLVGGYEGYRNETVDLSWAVRRVLATAQANDLPIVVYEYLPIDFAELWPNDNDQGHALATFQMLGDQLSFPEVSLASLWNTRWFRQAQSGFNFATSRETLFDAVKPDGSLTPTGQAISLWGNNALDDLLFTTETQYTSIYATASSDGSDATVFVVNRDIAPITLDIDGYHLPGMQGAFAVSSTSLVATGAGDRFPSVVQNSPAVTVAGNRLSATFPAVSITAIRIDGSLTRNLTANVATSCLADDGRFDVQISNVSGITREAFVSITGLPERSVSIAPGATESLTVTGRRDGDYRVLVSADGIAVLTHLDQVRCDPALPGPEGSVLSDCLAGNGRIRVSLQNSESTIGDFVVQFGPMAPRFRTLAPFVTDVVVITGRPDGDYPLTVTRNGAVVLSTMVQVDCDPNPTVEVDITNSCLADNGRIDVMLGNIGQSTAVYSVEFGDLGPRTRTLAPNGSTRVTITGRRDGVYPLTVSRDGAAIASETITVACDPLKSGAARAFVEATCLSGNGRIDIRVENDETAATFTAKVGSLTPRTAAVPAGSDHTFIYTGRPDGPLTIRIDRNGSMLFFTTVNIGCD